MLLLGTPLLILLGEFMDAVGHHGAMARTVEVGGEFAQLFEGGGHLLGVGGHHCVEVVTPVGQQVCPVEIVGILTTDVGAKKFIGKQGAGGGVVGAETIGPARGGHGHKLQPMVLTQIQLIVSAFDDHQRLLQG